VSGAARLLQGNAACAAGAIAAGCRFYAGYPITPSSEIAEEMARRLPALGGVFVQMEDEMASLAAVIGASLGGTKAMTATSGPGFSLMQEHIGFAAMAEIPCVIVNVMRAGPSTGLPTSPAQGDMMQARWGTHGDVPSLVLAPASVAEVHDLTRAAFTLSERFRTPVVVLYDEVIGHMREEVVHSAASEQEVPGRRRPPTTAPAYRPYEPDADGIPPMADFGSGYRFHVTGLAHDARGYPTQDPATIGPNRGIRTQRRPDRHRGMWHRGPGSPGGDRRGAPPRHPCRPATPEGPVAVPRCGDPRPGSRGRNDRGCRDESGPDRQGSRTGRPRPRAGGLLQPGGR